MWRMLPVCALMLVVTSFCWGDDKAPKANTTVIRLKLKPMAAPKPALKYQLLPELREMNPGNPIQGYLKCFMEQGGLFYNKQAVDQREKWLEMPLHELPVKELRDYGGRAARDADYAARLDTPDWQILLKLKSEGIHLLLPEVQSLRNLAAVLKVRLRGAIADRRFDDALVTVKTMLALSRHLGEHPTIIGDLVGIAIAEATVGSVWGACPFEEMIQQPGCPNLFWALTDLPRPFIDLRKGVQGERVWMDTELEGLKDREPMTEKQLSKIMERLRKDLQLTTADFARLNEQIKDEEKMRAARKRLSQYGLTEEKLKDFPPLQVILLDGKREYEEQRDDEMKAMTLPYWQAIPIMDARNKRFKKDMVFVNMVASFDKVKAAQARLDQRIALLRCVEALRLYAADHACKLPAKLEDIDLPLPVDPVTGKPFSYKVEGDTAHLQGARLIHQVRYEVTLIK
jgi:hypothetical protein